MSKYDSPIKKLQRIPRDRAVAIATDRMKWEKHNFDRFMRETEQDFADEFEKLKKEVARGRETQTILVFEYTCPPRV